MTESQEDSVTVSHNRLARTPIDLEQVKSIDSLLDEEDQLKLIFLLYDAENEVDLALQKMAVYLESCRQEVSYGPGPLLQWAQDQKCNWTDKMVESLCLTQNFQLVKRYAGLSDVAKDIAKIAIDSHSFHGGRIKRLRKAFFYLCNNVTRKEEEKLKYKMGVALSDPMEVALLKWISQHTKPQNQNCYDYSGLFAALKEAGVPQNISQYFKSLLAACGEGEERLSEAEVNLTSFQSQNSEVNSLASCTSLPPIENREDPTRWYKMDPKNAGLCIIINQRTFEPDIEWEGNEYIHENLEDRIGTDVDRDNLRETFKMFGYEVIINEDQAHNSMTKNLSSLASTVDFGCSLVVCILTHGLRGEVLGSDCISVSIDEIINIFTGKKCRSLIKKPKMFFIQACQGKESQEALVIPCEEDNVGPKNQPLCPDLSDHLMSMSTVPGFTSFRNKETGSIYIKSLCRVLQDKGHKYEIQQNLTDVNCIASSIRAKVNDTIKQMMPLQSHTFTKHLKFVRNREGFIKSLEWMIARHLTYSLFEEYLTTLTSEQVNRFLSSI